MLSLLVSAALAAANTHMPPPQGALNPNVTQANIHQTICVKGWTGTIRPPASVTEPMKIQDMKTYHLAGKLVDYEEDHFIPLELGGAPNNRNNLWAQHRAGVDGALTKDRVENGLRMRVCAGHLTLSQAQLLVRVHNGHPW